MHHKYYGFNNTPWEHNDDELETICAPCHKKKHFPEGVLVGPKIDRRPDVVKAIDVQIEDLKQGLLKNPTGELMEEILKSIMFLRGERKQLIKY